MYRSQHEICVVFKNGKASHVNNVQLGRFGRNRTNVWRYEGCNSPSKDRRADLKLHPTVKPVAMIADAIRDASNRDGLILDAFLGSGTTVIACEQTGRVCAGLELDPKYVDVIVRRWQGSENPLKTLVSSPVKAGTQKDVQRARKGSEPSSRKN